MPPRPGRPNSARPSVAGQTGYQRNRERLKNRARRESLSAQARDIRHQVGRRASRRTRHAKESRPKSAEARPGDNAEPADDAGRKQADAPTGTLSATCETFGAAATRHKSAQTGAASRSCWESTHSSESALCTAGQTRRDAATELGPAESETLDDARPRQCAARPV